MSVKIIQIPPSCTRAAVLHPKLLDWKSRQRFACKRSPRKTSRLHAARRCCKHSSREARATAGIRPLQPRAKMAIDRRARTRR
eukprot:976864-Pyramimonas_sp.AAC.1